ncbi:MAG TPA: glycosyltransferase family 39 protein [Solirubrobacteraceae bacterium]|jgi:4-amino-4-deoxy-L-arabinose transferase-like glycosyltransferase|nr:glycosyltransferase family 39 protein [Solirubrobacteraceae bacterium]
MTFSWETESAAPAVPATRRRSRSRSRGRPLASSARARALLAHLPRPELIALLLLAGALDLWALSRNGWANDYYSAAARSMSSSWHDFLYASMDPAGVMTVDKPPLSVWVQALSVRAFGYHQLSVLVPQALMGVASVGLVYDLVRRRFGRLGGFAAGLVLATTPIAVAVSRHNNPDALLVLCCVAALWCAVRGLDSGRTRWLVLAGVCVGLGFETKMGVALTVVPGIAAAWLWIDPRARGRVRASGQLLAGGIALVLVGGAWPLLVELTPAGERPWISGTSDNSILSLMLDYNGLNRVGGQAGVPAGAGGSMSGGTPGPLRLLSSALGGQVGWLLGFALVTSLGMLVASRLRRSDPRSGWLIAVGGAFLTTAVLFSAAGGIFHPYYVSLLAPFLAALAGAGFAQLASGRLNARVLGPLALAVGVAVELVIRARYPGQLPWLAPLLLSAGAVTAVVHALASAPRVRLLAAGTALALLLAAPAAWALDTLGYAASGTFPSGGPASVATGPGGGPVGGRLGRLRSRPGLIGGAGGQPPLFGLGPGGAPSGAPGPAPPGAAQTRPEGAGPQASGASPFAPPAGIRRAFGFGFGRPRLGRGFGDAHAISGVLGYVREHGGGTIAVSSQSNAAAAIVEKHADVAGIGGFSGRESEVSIAWLTAQVRAGRIRWVLVEPTSRLPGAPGDTRAGARSAMRAVASACTRTTLAGSSAATHGTAAGSSAARASTAAGSSATPAATLYDCRGRAAALAGAGRSSA